MEVISTPEEVKRKIHKALESRKSVSARHNISAGCQKNLPSTDVLRKLGTTEWPCIAKKGIEASTSAPEKATAS
ncbi:hypothetical protein Tco_1048816 [Tanacetum coccineum]